MVIKLRECPILNKQRGTLKNVIIIEGGRWPLTNSELVNKHMYIYIYIHTRGG